VLVGSVESTKAGKLDDIAELKIEGFSLGAKEGPSDGIEESTIKAFGSIQKSVLVMDIPEHPGIEVSFAGFV